MTTAAELPVHDADLYDDGALLEPHRHYRALRELGPVVYLSRHDAFAVARYAEAKTVLTDTDAFRSAGGIALNEPANAAILGCTLASDGDLHRRLRKVLAHRLTARAMLPMHDVVRERADRIVEAAVAGGRFDAVVDLAQALSLAIVPDFLGLPVQGREHLLPWARANFDSFGPMNARAQASLPLCGQMAEFGATIVRDASLLPGSLGADVLAARDGGVISTEQATMMMLDYLAPSLDTTISAVGSALHLFGTHPAQWEAVRADPTLIPNAVHEVLRLEAPIRGLGRQATRDVTLGGVPVAAGSQMLVLYASANRDERRFPRPDDFDVTRPGAAEHLSFGYGEHHCAGQALARMEVEYLLAALVRTVRRIEVGTPVRTVNNLIRGFDALPVSVELIGG